MAKRTRRKLRILFATSEAVPFAKTGGLGDVGGSLPQALAHAGAKVSLIMPKYSTIPERFQEGMRHIADFNLKLAWRNMYCGIEKLSYGGVDCYFVDNEYFFDRSALYGEGDDAERFAFFSMAICEAIGQVEELACDVVHCNDWQTALVPVFLRELYQGSEVHERVKCVMSVHNVKFQGQYSDYLLGDILGLHGNEAAENQLRSDERSINYLRGGLCYADELSTVSPTYAEELRTEAFGEGLQDVFERRSDVLEGVLNGIDMADWDPETDPALPANFSAGDKSGKAACKKALQEELGLVVDEDAPLIGMVGRLTAQKGLDLVNHVMDSLVERGFQFAILGTGDAAFEESLLYFDWRYRGRVRSVISFDDALARRIYAGSDLFLMPSQFEPCGLSQMI
ncbi:MAG: glycogen synthase, partial [Atopobiaceae bacterium]|nr:glycogen synthase [Atopobiaceae bacterium]